MLKFIWYFQSPDCLFNMKLLNNQCGFSVFSKFQNGRGSLLSTEVRSTLAGIGSRCYWSWYHIAIDKTFRILLTRSITVYTGLLGCLSIIYTGNRLLCVPWSDAYLCLGKSITACYMAASIGWLGIDRIRSPDWFAPDSAQPLPEFTKWSVVMFFLLGEGGKQ